MVSALFVVAALAMHAPASAWSQAPATVQAEAARPQPDRSVAYFEFLDALRLEGDSQVEAAIAALQRAARAAPESAEIPAELAGVLLRQNRVEDALAAAEGAVRLDPANGAANKVLGEVEAARLLSGGQAAGTGQVESAERAIGHLEKAAAARPYDLGVQLTLGRLLLQRNRPDRAAEVLAALVDREPGMTEASWLLAQAHRAGGHDDRAITVLEDAVAVEPRFYRGLLLLGELYERAGRMADAAAAYGRAAAESPRAVEIRVRQGSALVAAGRAAEARQLMEEVVRAQPTEAAALFVLAEAQREVSDLAAAAATARRLITLEPNGLRGAFALAQVEEERHDPQAVVAALEPALARHTGPGAPAVPLFVRLGLAYQELGKYDQALAAFEEARRLAPDPDSLGPLLAQAHLAAGRYDRAIEVARAARAARPGESRLLRLEAQALRAAGRPDEALALLGREAAARASDLDVQLAYAGLLSEAGRFEDAAREFDAAEARVPGRVAVPFQRGAALERAGRHAEAEAAFRMALERDPLDAQTLNYLGYMLAERGERLDEAVRFVERALEIDPENPSYLDSLGWARFRAGEPARALPLLERAAARLPRTSVVHDHLGDVRMALGDRDGAVEAWRHALAGDREDFDAAAVERKLADAQRQ
jgi:tetratricopeptide (TPR) repeat protein